jgi:hypothetical protein
MKRLDKIFLTTLCLAFSLTTFTSCKTTTNHNDTENNADTIPSTHPPPPPEWVDTSKIIKEKVLLEYIDSAKTVRPNPKNGVPFDKLDYDKIIAYDFAGSEEPYPSVIDEIGKFVPVVLEQQFLTQKQADKIQSTLTSKSTYGEATAACFQPHLALVFYKDNKMINQINICLDCNYLISDITIPAETHKKVNAGTKDEYAITGFTKSGKKAIIDLCKQLNFTYGATEENSSK